MTQCRLTGVKSLSGNSFSAKLRRLNLFSIPIGAFPHTSSDIKPSMSLALVADDLLGLLFRFLEVFVF